MRKYLAWCLAVSAVLLTGAASAPAQVLFGATGTGVGVGTLGTLDPATGAFTPIGPINDAQGNNFRVTGLAFHPITGVLYGGTARRSPTAPLSLITIDPATALATVVGDYEQDSQVASDLTFRPDGTLYGWFEPTLDALCIIDPATGVATLVGGAGISTSGASLASSAAGTLFFVNGGNALLNTLNPTTGLSATLATLSGHPVSLGSFPSIAFDSAGTLFGVNFDDSSRAGTPAFLVTIDPVTGVVTNRGQTIDGLGAIAFQVTPTAAIPEPSSLALCGAGGLSLIGMVRRRRKSVA